MLLPTISAAAVVFGVGALFVLIKNKIDARQEDAVRAGAIAEQLGFPKLPDFFYAVGVGNIAKARRIIKEWATMYVGEDGPAKLARDVIVNTYAKVRTHPKYGNEIRGTVMSAVLGQPVNDKLEAQLVIVSGRAKLLGMDHTAEITGALAVKDFDTFGNSFRTLASEAGAEGGLLALAMKVAPKTLNAIAADPQGRKQIEPLLREILAKIDAEAAAAKAA